MVPQKGKGALRQGGGEGADGVRSSLWRGRIRPALFGANDLFLARLERVPRRRPSLNAGVFWAKLEELSQLASLLPREAEFRRLFAQGCLVAFSTIGAVPAGMVWIDPRPGKVAAATGINLQLEEGEAWVFGGYVAPAFRGQGLFQHLLYESLRLLRHRGIDTLWCSYSAEDESLIRAHRKVGFVEHYRIRTVRLAGLTWHQAERVKGKGSASRGLGPWSGTSRGETQGPQH